MGKHKNRFSVIFFTKQTNSVNFSQLCYTLSPFKASISHIFALRVLYHTTNSIIIYGQECPACCIYVSNFCHKWLIHLIFLNVINSIRVTVRKNKYIEELKTDKVIHIKKIIVQIYWILHFQALWSHYLRMWSRYIINMHKVFCDVSDQHWNYTLFKQCQILCLGRNYLFKHTKLGW